MITAITKMLAATLLCSIYVFAEGQDAPGPKLYFTSHENSRADINSKYHYQCLAFDSSGVDITYKVVQLPVWLTFDAATRSLSGTPVTAGQYPVAISVTNGSATAYQRFMLTVCNAKTVNILCLGNSITNGTSTFNSYRRALWQMLHKGNYNFDMVGSWSKHHWGTDVPDPDFDMDHDGHSGWTAAHMFNPPGWDSLRGNLPLWLKGYTPDIVLIELGTNDVFQCRKTMDIVADLTRIIDTLRSHNSHVKVIVAQIPPLGQQWAPKKLCGDSVMYDTRIHALNKAILALANNNSTKKSPVIAVDQYTGVNSATDMYDDIHPNTKGEEEMAKRWFEKMTAFIPTLPKP